MESASHVTKVARIWLGDDGIVRVIHNVDAVVTLEDAQEVMSTVMKLRSGVSRPLLVDSSSIKVLARDARQYLAGEDAAKVATAAAIIVGTPVSRVLGSFYLGLSHPKTPSKLFTSEKDALEWLKDFLV